MAKVTDTRGGIATKEGLGTIANRLVRLRKEAGLSQAQMAEKLGISQPVVSDYERGASRLHGELILKVAEILNVSADELLGKETNKPKARPTGKVQRSSRKSPISRAASKTKSSSSSQLSSASSSKPKSEKKRFLMGKRGYILSTSFTSPPPHVSPMTAPNVMCTYLPRPLLLSLIGTYKVTAFG
jgi:transcriptional regulator with XRE-family HTH domain